MLRRSANIQPRDNANDLGVIRLLHCLAADYADERGSIRVHLKNRVGVGFVADLVDFLFAAGAAIEAVRAVDHDAVHVADVLITVNDARGYQHRRRIVRAHDERRRATKRLRVLAIVPEPQLEIRWTKKTKEVSLIDVLVRPASDARVRR